LELKKESYEDRFCFLKTQQWHHLTNRKEKKKILCS